jgi:hypothetical protein
MTPFESNGHAPVAGLSSTHSIVHTYPPTRLRRILGRVGCAAIRYVAALPGVAEARASTLDLGVLLGPQRLHLLDQLGLTPTSRGILGGEDLRTENGRGFTIGPLPERTPDGRSPIGETSIAVRLGTRLLVHKPGGTIDLAERPSASYLSDPDYVESLELDLGDKILLMRPGLSPEEYHHIERRNWQHYGDRLKVCRVSGTVLPQTYEKVNFKLPKEPGGKAFAGLLLGRSREARCGIVNNHAPLLNVGDEHPIVYEPSIVGGFDWMFTVGEEFGQIVVFEVTGARAFSECTKRGQTWPSGLRALVDERNLLLPSEA